MKFLILVAQILVRGSKNCNQANHGCICVGSYYNVINKYMMAGEFKLHENYMKGSVQPVHGKTNQYIVIFWLKSLIFGVIRCIPIATLNCLYITFDD